jgi:hypothetical protein
MCGCVYKIEKFRTLSAPSEIASQFPPPLRSNKSPNESNVVQIIFFYFLGPLGQAIHQAVSKKRPKPPIAMLDTFGIG